VESRLAFSLQPLAFPHAGELRREHGENRAERIIGEELKRLGWTEADLKTQRKNTPGKLDLAARLRREVQERGWRPAIGLIGISPQLDFQWRERVGN
jgi:hypothetical protein